MRFTVRGLLFFTLIAALSAGWLYDHRRLAKENEQIRQDARLQDVKIDHLKTLYNRVVIRSRPGLPIEQSPGLAWSIVFHETEMSYRLSWTEPKQPWRLSELEPVEITQFDNTGSVVSSQDSVVGIPYDFRCRKSKSFTGRIPCRFHKDSTEVQVRLGTSDVVIRKALPHVLQ